MHYHLLYGSTQLDSPEHSEFFTELKKAESRFQEIYDKYVKDHPNIFFKKFDEDEPTHTIMFGEIPGAIHGTANMESVVYGAEFKDVYMITIASCEDQSCLLKIN